MTTLPAPRSRAELLRRARQEARLSMGRTAFVRDARVLPIGLPLGIGFAALVVAARRPGALPRRHRARRDAELATAGLALGVLGVSVAAAWAAARVEWDLRRAAWDRERGWE